MPGKIPRIFIAYARNDAHLLEKLRTPLSVLQNLRRCEIFYDGEIKPGEHWDDRLKEELRQADIFILLVSDDFLTSDYVNQVELPKALELHQAGKATVLPVIVKECMWKYTQISRFQIIAHNGRPISTKRDGFAWAAHKIVEVIESLSIRFSTRIEEAEPKPEAIPDTPPAPTTSSTPTDDLSSTPPLQEVVTSFAPTPPSEQPDASLPKLEMPEVSLPDPFQEQMVLVKGSSFMMGSAEADNELPVHTVTVPDFHISKYLVTQAQWKEIMGSNPSFFQGDDERPVENVSWHDAKSFLQKLNEKTGKAYRLPTEAEWEYAARGGTKSKNYLFAGSDNLDKVAWHKENSENTTSPVGQKKPNELGLYDMSGNVWEWCEDVWHDNYDKAPTDGSAWVIGGNPNQRVVRGGAWLSGPDNCRVSERNRLKSDAVAKIRGFRIART